MWIWIERVGAVGGVIALIVVVAIIWFVLNYNGQPPYSKN
jgi:hypothetical protein